MTDLPSLAGLARSLAIYRARPWRISALARFYRQFLNPGDLAFDIGAHAGNRSLAMVRAGARVVALEPQPLFAGFLTRTLPSAVTVLPLAAGARVGRASLAVSRRHPTVSSLDAGFQSAVAGDDGFRSVRWDRSHEVELTTLDALIERFGAPVFVKIDVEGYEADVLAGLSRALPMLAFEYLPAAPGLVAPCLAHLTRLGRYEFNLVVGEASAFHLDAWVDAEAIAEIIAAAAAGGPGDVYARLRPA